MAIPKISLKDVPFQFADFKAAMYEQKLADKNILRQSYDKDEARRREANASKDSFIASTSPMRELLDPSEYANFDFEKANIQNQISAYIDLGNTGKAIEFANTAGKNLADDPKWKNKMKVYSEREEWIKKAEAQGYNEITIRRMKKENPYYDDGTGTFKHKNYSRVIAFSDIVQMAIQRTPPRQNANTSSTEYKGDTFSKDGKITSNPLGSDNTIDSGVNKLYSSSSSHSSSRSVTELREQDMYNSFKQLITEPDIKASLQQQFSDTQWLYQDAINTLNDPNASEDDKKQAIKDKQLATEALQGENGFIIKGDVYNEEIFNRWVETNAKKYFKNAAYKHVTTSSSSSSGISYNIANADTVAQAQAALAAGAGGGNANGTDATTGGYIVHGTGGGNTGTYGPNPSLQGISGKQKTR